MKRQEFFKNLDWQALARKERNGPLKPHLSGYYFDAEYVEELTPEEMLDMTL